MTVSEQERVQVNELLGVLRVTEQWIDQRPPAVQPGSSLAGDDRRTDPHQLSHAVMHSMGVAIDHLHTLRMAMTGQGDGSIALHTYSPLTLIRAAIENAATAVWMLSPTQREARIMRLVRYEMASVKNAQSFMKAASLPEQEGMEQRRLRLLGIADRCRLPEVEVKKKLSTTEILKDAGATAKLVDKEHELAPLFWRLCSAVTHGDSWIISMLDREEHEQLGPNVSMYRITAPTQWVVSGAHASLALIHTARNLYEQRATSHL
ncbi:hypothetical protein OG598_24985 [Micromonospora sp. NBC_00330]|uniref:hypothetical protein n=1 Tax=Micromonospora sp. NBC_00330 TaxID=2903585 RepID=UPI002E2BA1E7|nr:hypothetical protein [Micromonospora sp. NBC_00330]